MSRQYTKDFRAVRAAVADQHRRGRQAPIPDKPTPAEKAEAVKAAVKHRKDKHHRHG